LRRAGFCQINDVEIASRGWFEEDVVVRIAADWLFNNPNRFFRLGFEEVVVPS